MAENIFDIDFTYQGKTYKGWVNPSEERDGAGKPVSFNVVLDGVHFAYLSFQDCSWSANQDRPAGLVKAAGKEIEKVYTL